MPERIGNKGVKLFDCQPKRYIFSLDAFFAGRTPIRLGIMGRFALCESVNNADLLDLGGWALELDPTVKISTGDPTVKIVRLDPAVKISSAHPTSEIFADSPRFLRIADESCGDPPRELLIPVGELELIL